MRPDGKPKGIGFVKFSMKSSFNKAIELNGSEHMGRSLNIEESHGKNNNQAPGGFGNKPNNRGPPQAQGDAVIESSTLFIGGLSYNSTVESLNQFFSAAGNVQSSRIVTDKETGNVLIFLFSQEDSVMLSFMMSKLQRKHMQNLMVRVWMVDTLDWMLRPREIEQMPQVVDAEDSVEAIEEVIEEDSVEDVAASEEAVEGSVEETEEDLVGLEQTHLWC